MVIINIKNFKENIYFAVQTNVVKFYKFCITGIGFFIPVMDIFNITFIFYLQQWQSWLWYVTVTEYRSKNSLCETKVQCSMVNTFYCNQYCYAVPWFIMSSVEYSPDYSMGPNPWWYWKFYYTRKSWSERAQFKR